LKKIGVFIFLWFLFSVLFPYLRAQEDFLKIEASVIPRKLSRGEEGTVLLRLSLQAGITVSPHPDFIIEFKPCEELVFPKNFFTASDLEIDTLDGGEGEYLDLKDAIKVPFTVSLEAKKGSHILEGRIKYFARSKKEDWLVKNTAKFYATFATRASVAKKES
jgi:hypothetical protein